MKSRIRNAYLALGRILNDPHSFGLAADVPKSLANALTAIRQDLFSELQDELSEENFLASELSQDADRPTHSAMAPGLRKTGS